MSVGLLIKEGQVGRKILPVEKLKINNIGGGESYWIPEETTEVDSLDVSENGLYYAINDDLDGYDQVNVNVPPDMDENDIAKGRKITGTGDDGNDYAYGLDEDGYLTVEQIPAAIHIVVPPRKLKYEDGETIDFTGIHVYLMDGNNKRFTSDDYPTGEIPFGELIFPETIADASKGSDTKTASSNLVTSPLEQPIPFGGFIKQVGTVTSAGREWRNTLRYSGTTAAICYGSNNFVYLFADSEPVTANRLVHHETIDDKDPPRSYDTTSSVELSRQYTYAGKTVYYIAGSDIYAGLELESLEPTVNANFWNSNYLGQIAWTLIYGDITEAGQEIPVQWMRSDGEILEDTFKIEVGAGGEPGPPEPDPWAGNCDVSWHGHTYNINRKIVPEVHYANGYCWQEGTTEYTVEQAVGFGWLIRIGM